MIQKQKSSDLRQPSRSDKNVKKPHKNENICYHFSTQQQQGTVYSPRITFNTQGATIHIQANNNMFLQLAKRNLKPFAAEE